MRGQPTENAGTPRSALTRECWWIVETTELGLAAFPGRVLAYQGAEVCRGLRMQVKAVRPALPDSIDDRMAVEVSRQELRDAQMLIAQRAGVLGRGNQHGTPQIATAPYERPVPSPQEVGRPWGSRQSPRV